MGPAVRRAASACTSLRDCTPRIFGAWFLVRALPAHIDLHVGATEAEMEVPMSGRDGGDL